MSPLLSLALAETVPTTLTGALLGAVTALGGVVGWLATRLLAAKDAHTVALTERDRSHREEVSRLTDAHRAELRAIHEERTEEVRALTSATDSLREHTSVLRDHAETLAALAARRSR